jgi:hypothetical protein
LQFELFWDNVKHLIIKITAWFLLIIAILLGLGILSLVFFVSVYIKEANLLKIVLVDMGFILFGLLIIAIGVGFFEFILSLIKIEEEIEEIEEEIGVEEKGAEKNKEKVKEKPLEEL